MTTLSLESIKKKSRQTDIASSFIQKSYELLEDQRFPDIVDWNTEGTAIIIKKPLEFGQIALPAYFKHSNLTSFVRQLNMYDFHKRRTSNYDHVYYHDLFQRGKKHLLKEIKRKNQESTLASIQKAIEALEQVQTGRPSESTTNIYENQLLKKLNKDALNKITSLENKLKELNAQNQALWNQVNHQNKKEDILVSFMAGFMKKKGITLDQLPEVLNNQFNLPVFEPMNGTEVSKLGVMGQIQEKIRTTEKASIPVNIGAFFSFGDSLSNSTEVSPSSPQSKGQFDFVKSSAYNKMLEQSEIWTSQNQPKEIIFEQSVLSKRGCGEEKDGYETLEKMRKRETSTNILEFKSPLKININISKKKDMNIYTGMNSLSQNTNDIMNFY